LTMPFARAMPNSRKVKQRSRIEMNRGRVVTFLTSWQIHHNSFSRSRSKSISPYVCKPREWQFFVAFRLRVDRPSQIMILHEDVAVLSFCRTQLSFEWQWLNFNVNSIFSNSCFVSEQANAFGA
jgi:hypothetical protein